MSAIENLISIAAERKTFLTSNKINRISRLIISLGKIISSFNINSSRPEAPQKTHIQIIEDILYKDPHFFDDDIIENFFSLKNDLDAGVINFPLDAEKHKSFFEKLKNDAVKRREELRKREKIECAIFYLVIIIVFLKFIF